MILQLGHAPDKLAGDLVPADEVEHLAPGIVLAPTSGASPGLHVLHSVDGTAEPLLSTQRTGDVPGLVNLYEYVNIMYIIKKNYLKVLTKAVFVTLWIPVIKYQVTGWTLSVPIAMVMHW